MSDPKETLAEAEAGILRDALNVVRTKDIPDTLQQHNGRSHLSEVEAMYLAKAAERVVLLEEALREYGHHTPRCHIWPCSCGLAAVLVGDAPPPNTEAEQAEADAGTAADASVVVEPERDV